MITFGNTTEINSHPRGYFAHVKSKVITFENKIWYGTYTHTVHIHKAQNPMINLYEIICFMKHTHTHTSHENVCKTHCKKGFDPPPREMRVTIIIDKHFNLLALDNCHIQATWFWFWVTCVKRTQTALWGSLKSPLPSTLPVAEIYSIPSARLKKEIYTSQAAKIFKSLDHKNLPVLIMW